MHGSPIEWALFAISLANGLVHVDLLLSTLDDSRRVRSSSPPPSRLAILVVESNNIGEAMRFSVSLVCVASGLIAIAFPPPPGVLGFPAAWKAASLTLLSAITLIHGLISRRYRRRILTFTEQRRRSTDGEYEPSRTANASH